MEEDWNRSNHSMLIYINLRIADRVGMLHDKENANMAYFAATQIIARDKFDVSPSWKWNGQVGSCVLPSGYDAPEIGTPFSTVATIRLRQIIGGKTVEMQNDHTVDRGRQVGEVFVDGKNLATYFPLYRT